MWGDKKCVCVCVCVCVKKERERVCVCVPSMVHHLIMMKGLKCTNEPQSYVTWNLVFLVGLRMVNRSEGRFQTNRYIITVQIS